MENSFSINPIVNREEMKLRPRLRMIYSTVIRTTVDVECLSIAKPETYDVYTCIVYRIIA